MVKHPLEQRTVREHYYLRTERIQTRALIGVAWYGVVWPMVMEREALTPDTETETQTGHKIPKKKLLELGCNGIVRDIKGKKGITTCLRPLGSSVVDLI
ncbi:hypothetical protein M0802_000421 [Mischocyttarus mexicanus]|nr:hypothetical protein M0802_000421 [Mischocyttarus mexicanus]